jgi:hypothetical protein
MEQLQAMGFDAASVKTALAMNNGKVDDALSMLLNQSQHEQVIAIHHCRRRSTRFRQVQI